MRNAITKSAPMATMESIMSSMPLPSQERLVDAMREIAMSIKSESLWDEAFSKTQAGLSKLAADARRQIAAGKSKPLDYRRL